jgi:HEAT repeat protein
MTLMPLFGGSEIDRYKKRGNSEKLIKALKNTRAETREDAAFALGELRAEDAVIPLIDALDDWNIDVRSASAKALGEIGDIRAVDPLARAVRDRSLRNLAIKTLIKIGPPSIKAFIELYPEAEHDLKLQIIKALGEIGGEKIIPPLIFCLKERNREIQDAAATAVVQVGRPALNSVKELLRDRRKAVRGAAIKIIGRINDPDSIDILIPMLKDENYLVQQIVVKELDRLGWRPDESYEGSSYWVIKKNWSNKDDAINTLVQALNDEQMELRLAAVRELGNLKSVDAIGPLSLALEDSQFRVRFAAVESLGEIDDLKVTEPLLHLMREGYEDLLPHVAKSLQKFGLQISKQLIELLKHNRRAVRKTAADVLGNIGEPRAVGPLLELLKDRDIDVVISSIESLGKTGDGTILESLIPFLNNSDYKIRESTITAMGEIGEQLATENLIPLLRDDQEPVRLAASKALGKIGDPHAINYLIEALKDGSLKVRDSVAEAIGNMGSASVKPLISSLGDWDKDVQAIRKSLTLIGSSAIQPLISALSSRKQKVSAAAAKVLENLGWQPPNDKTGAEYYIAKKQWIKTVEIGGPAVEPLIRALSDPDVWIRVGAAESLGNIGDGQAVAPLINLFHDKYWNVRDAAVDALVKIGDIASKPLIEIIKHRNIEIIEYAARALGAIGDEQAIEPLNDALFDELKKVRRAAAAALEKIGVLSGGRRCQNCGKPIPKSYRTGDSCPFCDEFLDI